MNNFINARIKGHNNAKNINVIKHNIRMIKSLSENEKDDFNMDPINVMQNFLIDAHGNTIPIIEDNKSSIYDFLAQQYREDRAKHNELYKASRGRNLREWGGSWAEGVLTFSEQMKHDLGVKYTQEELIKVAHAAASEIVEAYGGELKYMTLHMDEKTPHFHYQFTNFDRDGLSLTHANNNTKFLSNLQDIAYKHFKALGMERGIKKELKGVVNYQEIARYWEKKFNDQKNEIETLKKDIFTLNKEKNALKNLFKDLGENIGKEFDETKSLRDAIYDIVKEYQIVEKEARDIQRELKKLSKQKATTNEELEEITKKIDDKTLMFESIKLSHSKLSDELDKLFKTYHKPLGNNDKLKEEILNNFGIDIMQLAHTKKAIEENKRLKVEVINLRGLDNAKLLNDVFSLSENLKKANNTIKEQKNEIENFKIKEETQTNEIETLTKKVKELTPKVKVKTRHKHGKKTTTTIEDRDIDIDI